MKLQDQRKAKKLNKFIKEHSIVWQNEDPESFVFIQLLFYYLKYYRKTKDRRGETREFKNGKYLIFVSYEKNFKKEQIAAIDLNSLLMVSALIKDTKIDIKVIKQHKVESYEINRHQDYQKTK